MPRTCKGFVPLLAVLLGVALTLPSGLAAACSGKRHLLTVRQARTLCARDKLPTHNVSVRGYFLGLPVSAGPGNLGVLFDHPTAVADAIHPISYPAPGTTPGVQQFTLAKGGLVVIGPSALNPSSGATFPESTWIVIKGPLACHLDMYTPTFVGGEKQPYIVEKSWHVPAATKAEIPS